MDGELLQVLLQDKAVKRSFISGSEKGICGTYRQKIRCHLFGWPRGWVKQGGFKGQALWWCLLLAVDGNDTVWWFNKVGSFPKIMALSGWKGVVVSNIFSCSPLPWEMIPFDEHVFQMGWNRQVVMYSWKTNQIALEIWPFQEICCPYKMEKKQCYDVSFVGV